MRSTTGLLNAQTNEAEPGIAAINYRYEKELVPGQKAEQPPLRPADY